MTYCTNCGKKLIKGASDINCEYCGHPLSGIQMEEMKKVNDVVDVSQSTKTYTIILLVIIELFNFIVYISNPIGESTSFIINIASAIIGYFVFGPWLASIGKNNNRDPNYGFVIGAFFGLIGVVIYWVWIKLFPIKNGE